MKRIVSTACATLVLALAAACSETPMAPSPMAAPGVRAADVSAGDAWIDVTAGGNFSCGLHASGAAECWGSNDAGQLNVPAGTYKQIDASGFNRTTCAIRTDDALACWGDSNESMIYPPSGQYKDVSMGLVHACAVRTDGGIDCWGRGVGYGEENGPWDGATDYVQVAAGFEYNCALKTDGSIFCWGGGGVGQTNAPNEYAPFTSVSAAYASSCATRTTGEMVCWGGRFGTEGVAQTGNDWTSVNGGGVGYCGVNSAGGIGCGYTDDVSIFTAPAGHFVQVDMGGEHACGILQDGSARCWGNPADGRTILPGTVVNAAPTATFNAPGSVNEGAPITLSLSGVVDESVATVTYAFDCGAGFGAFGASSTASCATTDNGVRTVRGKVRDSAGLSSEYTANVTIDNVAPIITFAGATIFAGETYSAGGSFTDPGADTYTATVNYGAGAGPLALSGKTFSLSHAYATAGTFTVTVTVKDDDQAAGSSATASVVVLSPAAAAGVVNTQVGALVTSGVLTTSEAAALTTKLDAAAASLASGNATAGVNQMNAFINQVNAYENSKRLSPSAAAALRASAERVIASAGGKKK